MTDWEREKQELLAYHDQLRGMAVALEEQLGYMLNAFELDTALWRARKALEIIIYELCDSLLDRPFGTDKRDTLEGVIDKLNKDKRVPERVCNAMHTLRTLGNRGTHVKPEPVTPREVQIAFLALAEVLHWYVADYKRITPPSAAADPGLPPLGPNPYLGLDAFEEKDAGRFFGREDWLAQEAWPAFQALTLSPPRLLALVGPSGSGKSSVARAGLLPLLARRLPACRVLVLTPTHRPLEALARALARQSRPDDLLPAGKTQEFLDLLQADTAGLRRIADQFHSLDARPLVVLLDQFEETYTLSRAADPERRKQQDAERRQFLDNLLDAITDPAPHLYLLLTLRSDFLADTQSHPVFNQTLTRLAKLVPVLDEDGLRRAIVEPARLAGRALDEGVVQLLLEQSAGLEGGLPLLQYALGEIWRGLQNGQAAADTLRDIGGVGGALAGRARDLYASLDAAGQAVARRCFLKLVQLGEGGPDTRQRKPLDDLIAEGEDRDTVRAVLHRFAAYDARFLTFARDAQGQDSVAITHDALIAHWAELKQWLDANRDDLRLFNRLDLAAKHWHGGGRARGLLWRRPDLDLLRQLARRRGAEFTRLQAEFHRASVKDERRTLWLKRGVVAGLLVLTLAAAGFAWEANRQKQQAQANLQKARQAVDQFYTQISENKLVNAPGMETLRRELLEKALRFYEELATQQQDDPDMRAELANASFRVGSIKQDMGDSAGAEAAYQRAIAAYEALVTEQPKNLLYRKNLVAGYNNLGNLQRVMGNTEAAQAAYQKKLDMIEQLVKDHPENAEYQDLLASGYLNLGVLHHTTTGNSNKAQQAYRKGIAIYQHLVKEHAEVPDYQRHLAQSYNNLGNLQRISGDAAGARESQDRALAIREQLVKDYPGVPTYQGDLADSHVNLSIIQADSGDVAAAQASNHKAIDIYQRLVKQHPEVPEYQKYLAAGYSNLGIVQKNSGDLISAQESYRLALAIRAQLAQAHPEVPEYQSDLAASHYNLGILQQNNGGPAGARESYRLALDIRAQLVQAHPEVPEYQSDLAASHNNLGVLQKNSGDIAGARESYQKALDIFERLAREHPEIPEYKANMDTTRDNLAKLAQAAAPAPPKRPGPAH